MRTIYTQDQINKTKGITSIIGDSNNLLILYELINFGEKSFNQLKRMTDINAVTLSKKLAHLKAEGLVTSRHYGNENRYFVTDKSDEFRPLIKNIERLVIHK